MEEGRAPTLETARYIDPMLSAQKKEKETWKRTNRRLHSESIQEKRKLAKGRNSQRAKETFFTRQGHHQHFGARKTTVLTVNGNKPWGELR